MAKLKKDSQGFEIYLELTPEEKNELTKHIIYVDASEAPVVPIELRSSGEAARAADKLVLGELEQNRIARGASHILARDSNVCN